MRKVTVEDMLAARDRRVLIQRTMVQKNCSLISFTLNTPGEIKLDEEIERCFYEGMRLLKNQLKSVGFKILEEKVLIEISGPEAFFLTAADPLAVKAMTIELEEAFSLGRLFDLDVLDETGRKLSRTELSMPQRRCLICGQEAHVCARSRAHSLSELTKARREIVHSYFNKQRQTILVRLVVQALFYEVSAAPKPGLVDRFNNGAHRDMDFNMFLSSGCALIASFEEFAAAGQKYAAQPENLMRRLRTIGKEAEALMFDATEGVNTHKGAIFSFGVFLGALTSFSPFEKISQNALRQKLCELIKADAKDSLPADTAGSLCYQKFHIGGLRKEAALGYPSVFEIGLPAFNHALKRGFSFNEAAIYTLLRLIEKCEDTSLIHRSDPKTLLKLQEEIHQFLKNEPNASEIIRYAEALDRRMIQENLSPGGSADLLALTFFLFFLQQKEILSEA